VGEWYRSGAAPKRIVEAALAAHAAQDLALKALWAAGSCLVPPLARITLVGVKTKWRIDLLVSMASDAGTRLVTLKRCFVVHVAY